MNSAVVDVEESVANAKNANGETVPLVSMLVLTYNNIEGIYPTLDSIFAQRYPRIELVISDDASRDFEEQRASVQAYLDQHAGLNVENVVINAIPHNVGTVKNKNSALSLAKGDYAMCLAAEDTLIGEDVLETYVIFMELNPAIDVCFGKLRGVTPDGEYKYELLACDTDYDKLRGFDRQQTLNHLFRRNFLPEPSAFYRMDAYARFGLHDEEIRLIEDYPFWIKVILQGGRFGYIDDYTVDYLLTGVSSAGEYSEQFMRDLMRIYDKYVFPNDRRFKALQGPYNILKRWGLEFYLAKAQWDDYDKLTKARKAVFYSPLFAFTWSQRKLNDLENKRIQARVR